MSISQDMRRNVRSLIAHYDIDQVSPGFMQSFTSNFFALADQVEQLETTVIPAQARGLEREVLPSNVVPIRKARDGSARPIDGGAA